MKPKLCAAPTNRKIKAKQEENSTPTQEKKTFKGTYNDNSHKSPLLQDVHKLI